jgi:dTMP kinase
MAARAQHVSERIRPALEAGQVVVCDRFTDATLAYQGGGRAVPRDLLARLNEAATGGLRPDRTYLLDVDVATGFARAGERTGQTRDRIEGEGAGFFESVRRRYLELAAEDPERIVLLRGTDSREDLSRQIREDALALLRSRDIHPSR